MRVGSSTPRPRWIIGHVNPPTEQLIRDYLNRLSLAARDKLGFAERQSLLDRTRARIEAECGGVNGASAVQVRKALAGLGDPIALVEFEVRLADGSPSETGMVHEHDGALNGRQNDADRADRLLIVKGSDIGKDMLVTGGPNGSRPKRAGGSVRLVRAGITSAQRRRARSEAQKALLAGSQGPPGTSLVPAQRRPPGPDGLTGPGRADGQGHSAAPGRSATEADNAEGRGRAESGTRQRGRFAGPTAAGVSVAARLLRSVAALALDNKLEFIAVILLGIGGAVYPPIWLLGLVFGLPSQKWDIGDKFVGIVLPVMLMIVGTAAIIVLGGPRGSIESYAVEAWLGAERLSRALAFAGACYLYWALYRGRRKPRQPPWNLPHRVG
jgi:hypothetical protein